MNKGCPKCGSKRLVGTPARKIYPDGKSARIELYTCQACNWQGEWSELKKQGFSRAGRLSP